MRASHKTPLRRRVAFPRDARHRRGLKYRAFRGGRRVRCALIPPCPTAEAVNRQAACVAVASHQRGRLWNGVVRLDEIGALLSDNQTPTVRCPCRAVFVTCPSQPTDEPLLQGPAVNSVPDVIDAAHVPPLPLALKMSGAPRPMVRSRPLPGERFDAGLQARVDRDGSPVIRSDRYRASNTGVSTHMRPGDWVLNDVDGAA
ncbi:DUF5999 family protein [Streptomyces globisporus]|uniref:DUF5999 family protein n=1 Tax=Streptomyces globisporus TaxID=1908 RepID=UPI0036C40AB9